MHEVFEALRAPRQANASSLGGSASVGDLHSTAFENIVNLGTLKVQLGSYPL